MFRCLRHHITDAVETPPPGAPADLLEIPDAQGFGTISIVLAELGEEHRADRHVHAHPERVRAANHLEQAALREFLDQNPVFRQQARMVDAYAMAQQLGDLLAIGAAEIRVLQDLRNRLFFLP